MSYRTKINGKQIFGNNESYPEWIEFIVSQGIEVDNEGCYEGNITDFMAMMQVIEKITLKIGLDKQNILEKLEKTKRPLTSNGIFDFSYIQKEIEMNEEIDIDFRNSLFDKLYETIKEGYAFMPYALYLSCKDKLEEDKMFSTDGHFRCYKLKEGETIKVSAG